jgi:hypothetical protein
MKATPHSNHIGVEPIEDVAAPEFSPLPPEFSDTYGEFNRQFLSVKNDPLNAILNGYLRMYAIEKSVKVRDTGEFLKKLRKAYKAFKKICDKPKSHLKAVNEVRPIETVKRVGYESIPYLASHSEDWLALTASGLKPARLFSRVEDDDFQIYENRAVKTAIDLICSFLKRERIALKDKMGQINVIISINETSSVGFDADFQKAVYELISQNIAMDEDLIKECDLAKELYSQVTDLWKKYRGLYQSRLYRYLRRAKPAANPLNETNILLMDKNYNIIFKVWKDIHKETAFKSDEKITDEDFDKRYDSYKSFCKTLCEYTAHRMKFEKKPDGTFYRAADSIRITISDIKNRAKEIAVEITCAKKRELKIERGLVCPNFNCKDYGNFEHRDGVLYWENTATKEDIEKFCSLLTNKSSRGKEQAKEKKHYIALKGALEQKHREDGPPKTKKIKIIPTFYTIKDETRGKFRNYYMENTKTPENDDYAIVVIALPKCEDKEKKLI